MASGFRHALGAAVLGAALCAPAFAQSFSTGAPDWSRALLAADMNPAAAAANPTPAPRGGVAARLTILPPEGGVARVIRYSSDGETARLQLLRFTGHPRTGWSQWGADTPTIVRLPAGAGAQLDQALRGALSASRLGGEARQAGSTACASGAFGYLEVSDGVSQAAFERRCLMEGASGAAIMALSRAAGSEDEEALHQAGLAELLDADRAFNAMAQDKGVPAAFLENTHEDVTLFVSGRAPFRGKAGVRARFADWPAAAKLSWAPEGAELSARGDMGWTWGRGLWTAADGKQTASHYVTVWRRDWEGLWRVVSDIGVPAPPAAATPPAAAPTPPAPTPPPATPAQPSRGSDLRR